MTDLENRFFSLADATQCWLFAPSGFRTSGARSQANLPSCIDKTKWQSLRFSYPGFMAGPAVDDWNGSSQIINCRLPVRRWIELMAGVRRWITREAALHHVVIK